MLLVWRRKWHSEHTPCAPALGQALCQGLHKQLRGQRQVDLSNSVLQIREMWLQLKAGRLQALALPTVQSCCLVGNLCCQGPRDPETRGMQTII